MKYSRFATVAMLVACLAVGSAVSAAQETPPPAAPPEDEFACEAPAAQDAHTGDVVADDFISAEVPPPDNSVTATVTMPDGGDQELTVTQTAAGNVIIHSCGAEPDPLERPDPDSQAPGACSDGLYDLKNYKWTEAMHWKYNAESRPSEVSMDSSTAAMKDGTSNITSADNDCGLTDQVAARHEYDGTSQKNAGLNNSPSKDVTCEGNGDGTSVVDWGDLYSGYLAVTCTWDRTDPNVNTAKESDVRFNKDDFQWTANPSDLTCIGRYGIEPVMTHERGHSYGLDHVSEVGHGNLTMSRASNGACQDSESTLGLGDVRGLKARY